MNRGRRGEEIPESRFPAPGADKLIEEVCTFYQVHEKDLLASRRGFFNEPRNVAIYLIRRLRGDNLDVKKGEDAIHTMKVLGQNMGWLIKKLNQ
ncbi:MAG: hypothetical protein JRF40_12930 [Deltaproteobacteria bacterium]|nr:hypothetical protein [Deltaproteobacteria bacterium]